MVSSSPRIRSLEDAVNNAPLACSRSLRLLFLVLAVERVMNKDVLVVTDLTRVPNNNVLYEFKNQLIDIGGLLRINQDMCFALWFLGGTPTISSFFKEYEAKHGKRLDPLKMRSDYLEDSTAGNSDNFIFNRLQEQQSRSAASFEKEYLFVMCDFRFKHGKYGYEGVVHSFQIVDLVTLELCFQHFHGLFDRLFNSCKRDWLLDQRNVLRNYILTFVKLKDEKDNRKRSISSMQEQPKTGHEKAQRAAQKTTKTLQMTSNQSTFVQSGKLVPLPVPFKKPVVPLKTSSILPVSSNRYELFLKTSSANNDSSDVEESQSMNIFEESQVLLDYSKQQPKERVHSISYLLRSEATAEFDKETVAGFVVFVNTLDFISIASSEYEQYLVKADFDFSRKTVAAYRSFKKKPTAKQQSLANGDTVTSGGDFQISRVQLALSDTGITGGEHLLIDLFNDNDMNWIDKFVRFLGYSSTDEFLRNVNEVSAKLQKLEQKKVQFKVSKKIVENKIGIKKLRWFYDDDSITIDDLVNLAQ